MFVSNLPPLLVCSDHESGGNTLLYPAASRCSMGPSERRIQTAVAARYPIIKQSGRSPDHSPPYRAEFGLRGARPPIPIRLHST